jgi:hypothetical protein
MKKARPQSKKISLFEKVGDDVAFHVIDGSTIKGVIELSDAIHDMSDDTYYYHSNKDKDDFSNWIKDVFGADDLADEMLRSAHTRIEEEVCILRHLVKVLKR